MYLKIRMRNRVIRVCQSCLYFMGHAFMFAMGSLILGSIIFAFWQLILKLL